MPVNITGVQGTLKAMRKFDPDLANQMNKQIKRAMIPIRDKARGYAPTNDTMLSNWVKPLAFGPQQTKYRPFPKYDQNETQKGIVYKGGANIRNRNGFQAVYYIANNSAGGAIYETAGRVSGLDGRKTEHIVASRHRINKKYKTVSGTRRDNNSLNPNAGRQLMAPMGPIVGDKGRVDPRFGNNNHQGRLIFRAWYEDQGRVTHAVTLAINTAVATFNATNYQPGFALAA
jgi:hypothetical protein